jgi:hypothetical protein
MSETNAATVSATPAGGGEVAEPVVVHGGDSPVSWSELENLHEQAPAKKEAAPKKPKKEEIPQESQEVKVEGKKGSDKKDAEPIEKSAAPAKILKLKRGDETLDIAADAMVPVKIDGKTTHVPLQEAINRYSQQSHLDKVYQTYKAEKQSFESERESISKALNKSYDLLVNQKDLRGFMEHFGEALGLDAQRLYDDAVTKIKAEAEELATLTPEERKLRELEEENRYYRSRMDAKKQEVEQAKSMQKLESHVTKVLDAHQMTKEDLVNSWDELVELGYEKESITPEFIAKYHGNRKKISFIEQTLKGISPELASDQSVIEELATNAITVDASEEEIMEAIKELYSDDSVQKLNKKINRSMRANAQGGAKAVKNPGSDPLFFDDIT